MKNLSNDSMLELVKLALPPYKKTKISVMNTFCFLTHCKNSFGINSNRFYKDSPHTVRNNGDLDTL